MNDFNISGEAFPTELLTPDGHTRQLRGLQAVLLLSCRTVRKTPSVSHDQRPSVRLRNKGRAGSLCYRCKQDYVSILKCIAYVLTRFETGPICSAWQVWDFWKML